MKPEKNAASIQKHAEKIQQFEMKSVADYFR